MVTEAAPEALAQKAMFDKGKACGDFSDAMGLKWLFFDALTPCLCVAVVDCWLVATVRMRTHIRVSSWGDWAKRPFKIITLFFHGNCSLVMVLGANLQPFQWRVSARLVLEATFF
jgi:hypothetical protein